MSRDYLLHVPFMVTLSFFQSDIPFSKVDQLIGYSVNEFYCLLWVLVECFPKGLRYIRFLCILALTLALGSYFFAVLSFSVIVCLLETFIYQSECPYFWVKTPKVSITNDTAERYCSNAECLLFIKVHQSSGLSIL